ncbi:hypothetical protein GDO81_021762 [Engystomops pustulosus]|uniref:Sushi domain-containing protein n=1 Tax=Engystomops pustulosus TaxID=76066 RepID=A0AAV6Z5I7_ENGPU|nr:hypothetical protein GDO81_021762 [Engystomops pustulosus]
MGNWGQNVSVDPEQDYYDPDQQVTATCPAGYIPNYSTAKCVRDNETNSWNVTEISCVIRTQSSDLGRNMTTLQRTLLGSCVAGLILPMALKFLTILVLSCAILIQNVRRRDRPTQRGAVANKTRHKDEELNPMEDLTLKRATLCIEALPYIPSPMRSHKVIYDNMDTMFPPPSRRLPAECK